MNRKQQVLLRLKPRAKALGFNKKELMGIAAEIADNLTSTDEASEEDVNAEIDAQIEAVLPYLSFGQSQANRLLDEYRKKQETIDEEEEEGDEDENPKNPKSPKQKKSQVGKKSEETPEWAKSLLQTVETLNGKIAALEGDKVTTNRRSKLEALLKDTGTFGSRTLKSFSKMKFDSDDEFDEFYSEVEDDLKALIQERADAGLKGFGGSPDIGGKPPKENEPFSDDEIDAMANGF